VGRHSTIAVSGGRQKTAARRGGWRPTRALWTLPVASFFVAFAIVLVMVVDPYSGAYADPVTAPQQWVVIDGQSYVAQGSYSLNVKRDGYTVTQTKRPPAAGAVVAGTPDPGSAKDIALKILKSRGMGNDQYSCLVSLWDRESHWNVYAANPSGAYGIPQALPGSKMASAGPNWQSNPKTQILWGLSYISARYGTPCGAWAQSQASGWY
jgi:hypothetical protein